MISVFTYVLCFVTGLLTKLTDVQTDEKVYLFKRAQFVTGLAYGLLAGYLMTLSIQLATLIAAITVGVLLTAKIDFKAHQLAIAALIAVIALFGLPQIDFTIFTILVFFSFLDEILNDFIDSRARNKLHTPKLVAWFASQRLTLEIAALAVSIVTGEWIYFLALLSFDLAYHLVSYLTSRFHRPLPGALGFHLTLDLFDCNVSRLEDAVSLKQFLNELPQKLGMRKVTAPVVKRIQSGRDYGYSGFVVIAESHISFHTFPKIHSCNLDVFSCKPFDQNQIASEAQRFFKAKRVSVHSITRSEVDL
ncbi:MAG: S-adenosylmethionine decarboxylase [Candidatus Micrarchaeota archaeon]